MKISLATRGGLTAAINLRLPPRVVDVDSLPKEAAVELVRLVDTAKNAPPAKAGPGSVADAMSYTITVENDGEPVVLRQSDTTMSPAFAALLGELEKHLGSH
jgi:hypothetical protein